MEHNIVKLVVLFQGPWPGHTLIEFMFSDNGIITLRDPPAHS